MAYVLSHHEPLFDQDCSCRRRGIGDLRLHHGPEPQPGGGQPDVEALVAANRTYPRWADFPAAPVDLPTSQALAARVDDLQGSSLRLAGETSSIDWTLDDPETLAAETRRAVGAVPTSPDAVRTEAEVEAFARRLRERAKAPPPIDRQP